MEARLVLVLLTLAVNCLAAAAAPPTCNGAGYDPAAYVCIFTGLYGGTPGNGTSQLCPAGLCACNTPNSDPKASQFGCYSPQTPCTTGTKTLYGCGKVVGDPRLTGFDGRRFDFAGTSGDVFNIITEAKHQLNVAMVDAELRHPGTFMTAAGLIYDNHLIEARVEPTGVLTVSADGARLQGSEHLQWDAASLTLNTDATILSLKTPMFVWNITAAPPSVVQGEAWKSHIELGVVLLSSPSALHGVMGQTLYGDSGTHAASDFGFYGEGQQQDYRVSNLFGSDFKYNLYGQELIQMPVSRALLSAPDRKYPVYASFVSDPSV